MKKCANCGNEYDKCFDIIMNGKTKTFDCFECAIQAMAPTCHHCNCKLIGHGVEDDGNYFCCAHCAREEGLMTVKDRA